MKLIAMGTRGSIPSPSKKYPKEFRTEEFGGNTTCYAIDMGDGNIHIIDAGSGIRELGLTLKKPQNINLYVTHTHWDHIQGVPFFVPAYIPDQKVRVYGEAKVEGDLIKAINDSDPEAVKQTLRVMEINGQGIKDVLEEQQNSRNFPVPLSFMAGLKNFYDFVPGGKIYENDVVKIESTSLNHPGGCVSYKFTEKVTGKKLVIATDFEPDGNGLDDKIVKWWEGANLVLADAQYEMGSDINPFQKGWGHSDYKTDIEIAKKAGVGKLLLTHHEPKMDDSYLHGLEARAQNQGIEVALAREGKTYEV